MKKASADNVTFLVQRRLRALGRAGHKVRVVRAERRLDKSHDINWWLIKAEVNVPLSQLHKYYELLSRVEEALESRDHINTLIVPFIPEEQAAA